MKRVIAFAIVVAALSIPSTAAAQTESHPWFASPFIGMTFSGDTTKSAPVYGAAAGWMGSRLGFEGEIADAPDFFEQTGFLTYRRVTTVMGNALYQFWNGGGARAYATGGAGLVRPHLAEAGDLAVLEVNKFGFNVGGGIIGRLSEHTGVRGDVRYIRTAGTSDSDANPFGIDLTRFEFWRASAGLVVKF
jgi:Outer membrane protein beta-barrel domain